jgi:GT2 family glycosyltransferase
MTGVTVVIPVHNGEPWIRDAVGAILADAADTARPIEVLLVDDCSRDGSASAIAALSRDPAVHVVQGPGRGAAAAINAGVRAARYPLIAQIDQDVAVLPGWLERLAGALDGDPHLAAAQGCYVAASDAALSARAMNLDLQQRYAGIDGRATDHVCTGNTIYRAGALVRIGLFDESLGYGYDNDLSYRLRDAGYGLAICVDARAVHRWREGLRPYLTQQYGFGYGRLDLVAKHPRRVGGDAVSPARMMVHPLVMCAALACGAIGWWTAAGVLAGALAIERLAAGIAAARRFGDGTALMFPVLHLLRDLAWVAAIVVWLLRRVARHPVRPSDSMTPRAVYGVSRRDSAPAPKRPSA